MPEQPARPYALFFVCFLSVALGAMDSALSAAYLPDLVRELTGQTHDAVTGQIGSWVNFAFLAGGALGGIALGFLSDRIGRRAVLALALVGYGAGSALGALADTWPIVAATRFLVGIGVGAALVLSAVILSEAGARGVLSRLLRRVVRFIPAKFGLFDAHSGRHGIARLLLRGESGDPQRLHPRAVPDDRARNGDGFVLSCRPGIHRGSRVVCRRVRRLVWWVRKRYFCFFIRLPARPRRVVRCKKTPAA